MSFASLLAGYATAKSAPQKPAPVKSEPPKHALYERLQSIRRDFRSSPLSSSSTNTTINLGILFIIIDEFPNELLWRLWLQQGNVNNGTATSAGTISDEPNGDVAKCPANVRVWFHAKNPDKVRSAWVRECLVRSFHFKPEWGSVEITKVMAHLLHEATYDAPHINKFCFASESCIPIAPLDTVLGRLYAPAGTGALPADCTSASVTSTLGISNTTVADGNVQVGHPHNECLDYDSSWLSFTDTANNGYAYQLQFEPLKKALPEECIYKASQWLMISRTHALAVLHLLQQLQEPHEQSQWLSHNNGRPPGPPRLCERIFSIFKDVRASDEMFFPCCLALLGFLPTSSAASSNSSASSGITSAATAGSTTNTSATTTAVPTTAVAVADTSVSSRCVPAAATSRVLCRQVTYSDWTNNAKNPADYGGAFPTALAAALRNAHRTSSNRSSSSTLKQLQVRKRDSGPELNVNADQRNVVFLRKVKFPAGKSVSLQHAAGSDSTSTGMAGTVQLSGEQECFLRDWLPFILQEVEPPSGGAERAIPDQDVFCANASDASDVVLNDWLQRAAELLQQIHASAVAVGAAGRGNVNAVPLVRPSAENNAHTGGRSNVRGTAEESNEHSRSGTYERAAHSTNDDGYRGSRGNGEEHYKRSRDNYNSADYDYYDNKRYRF